MNMILNVNVAHENVYLKYVPRWKETMLKQGFTKLSTENSIFIYFQDFCCTLKIITFQEKNKQ